MTTLSLIQQPACKVVSPKFASQSATFDHLKSQLQAKDSLEVTREFQPSREPLIQGSIGQGISRALKKTFLRPRGLVELALVIAPGHVGLVFIGKSFLEGLFGADSLIIPRKIGFKLFNVSKQFDGRTIVGGIQNWITGSH